MLKFSSIMDSLIEDLYDENKLLDLINRVLENRKNIDESMEIPMILGGILEYQPNINRKIFDKVVGSGYMSHSTAKYLVRSNVRFKNNREKLILRLETKGNFKHDDKYLYAIANKNFPVESCFGRSMSIFTTEHYKNSDNRYRFCKVKIPLGNLISIKIDDGGYDILPCWCNITVRDFKYVEYDYRKI